MAYDCQTQPVMQSLSHMFPIESLQCIPSVTT